MRKSVEQRTMTIDKNEYAERALRRWALAGMGVALLLLAAILAGVSAAKSKTRAFWKWQTQIEAADDDKPAVNPARRD